MPPLILLLLLYLSAPSVLSQEDRASTPNLEGVLVHQHKPLAVPSGFKIPELEAWIHVDPSNGFNLELKVANYELEAPELAGNTAAGSVEGHAHIMINGKKRIRLYSTWIHLDSDLFQPGMNQLTVTLNSHDHSTWVVGRQPLLATIFLDTSAQPVVRHRFSSSPLAPIRASAD